MPRIARAALLGALLLAAPAWAADGDAWGSYADTSAGEFRTQGWLICDNKVAADTDCAEFDLETKGRGIPEKFTIDIILIDGACSGSPDFQLQGAHTTGGVKTDLGFLMAEAGIDSQKFSYTHRFLSIALTDDAGCASTGNDLSIVTQYEK